MIHRPPRRTLHIKPSRDAPPSEHAKWWRQSVVELTREGLAEKIGYSLSQVALFERGTGSRGGQLGVKAWQKYRMACAAVQAKAEAFYWEE